MPRRNSTSAEAVEQEVENQQQATAEADVTDDMTAQTETDESISESALEVGDGGMDAADTSLEEVDHTEEPEVPGWQRTLQEAGFGGFDGVDNFDTAAERAVQAIRQREEQLERLSREVKFYQDQGRSQSQSPQALPEAKPEVQDRDLLSNLLDGWEDPRWAEQYIEADEDGVRRLRDDIDDVTREKVLEADRRVRQWSEVLQDPRQFATAIDKRVEHMIQERFEQGFEQRQTQQREEQAVSSFVQENAGWLYEQDAATGQYLQDPVSGEYLYSKDGTQFLQHMQQAAEDGIQSKARQIHYAQMALQRNRQEVAQTAPARRQSVQSTIDQRKKEMRSQPNRQAKVQNQFNGVSPNSGSDPVGRNTLSFGEETLELMKSGVE